MGNYSFTYDMLDFEPQNLHLSIWDSKSTEIQGVIAACHGLTSSGTKCYHYFGPYMAERGWTTLAIDLPGFGHWEPEESKAKKAHWAMLVKSIEKLLIRCNEISPTKQLALMGTSISSLPIIDYILDNNNAQKIMPNYVILIAPALAVSFPKIYYPLFLPLVFLTPNLYLRTNRFEPKEKSNDPQSIVNYPDSFDLKKISFGMLFEIFKSQMKLKVKRKSNPMNNWPPNIPLLIITGGNDVVTNSEYVEFFHKMLPSHIKSQYVSYLKAHHYILYELNREKIFQDILNFLNNDS